MNYSTIRAWRQPTKYELKFGEGAAHYLDFTEDAGQANNALWIKPDGTLKRWIKFNGLRYNRF